MGRWCWVMLVVRGRGVVGVLGVGSGRDGEEDLGLYVGFRCESCTTKLPHFISATWLWQQSEILDSTFFSQ